MEPLECRLPSGGRLNRLIGRNSIDLPGRICLPSTKFGEMARGGVFEED